MKIKKGKKRIIWKEENPKIKKGGNEKCRKIRKNYGKLGMKIRKERLIRKMGNEK